MTETYMSLLLNIVHVSSTENTIPLSSLRWRSFFSDSWWLIFFPQLRSGLWSFEFSSSDQTVNNLSVHCFERFLDHTEPRLSEPEQNPVILTFTLCEGSYLKACRWRSHRTSKSWTSSFCKRILNKSESPCTAYKLWLDENAHRSCQQFVSSVRVGRVFERVALRHLLFFGSEHACRDVFFSMQTQSSHQAYRSRGSLRPVIDCDVTRSSIDFAISTSLIHCIVRWGSADFEHTSVLKLTFQLWNSMESGKFSQVQFRNRKSRLINHATVTPVWLNNPPPLW